MPGSNWIRPAQQSSSSSGGGGQGGGTYQFVWQPGGTEDAQTNTYTTWATLHAAVAAVSQFAPVEIYYDNSNADGSITSGAWPLPTEIKFSANPYNDATIEIDDGATIDGIASVVLENVRLRNNSTAVVYAGPGIALTMKDAYLASSTGNAVFKITSSGGSDIRMYGGSGFERNGGAGDKPVVWQATNTGTMVISANDTSFIETNTLKNDVNTTIQLQLNSPNLDAGTTNNTAGNSHASVAGTLTKLQTGRSSSLGVYEFIWQPGGTAQGNIYTTWATLMAAIALLPNQGVPVEVYYDPTDGTANITTGAWELPNYFILRCNPQYNSEVITIDDGATFTGIATLVIQGLTLNSNSLSPVYAGTGDVFIYVIDSFLRSQNVKMFSFTSDGADVFMLGISALENFSVPIFSQDAAGTLTIHWNGTGGDEGETLACIVGATVIERIHPDNDTDYDSNTYAAAQPGILGTRTLQLQARAEYLGIEKRTGANASSGDSLTVSSGLVTWTGVRQEQVFPVPIMPNQTVTLYWFAPYAVTITGIKAFAATAPASAGGTYTMAVTGAGNNLLNAATYNLEGLVSGTLASATLTGTTSNLNLAAGAIVVFTITSNNDDLTGDNLNVQILYRPQ